MRELQPFDLEDVYARDLVDARVEERWTLERIKP